LLSVVVDPVVWGLLITDPLMKPLPVVVVVLVVFSMWRLKL
jgi:hypothetical protein